MPKVGLLWSGGKDALMALEQLKGDPDWQPTALLTTFTQPGRQVSMHRVPAALIERQAEALGLPLYPMYVPEQAGNTSYERAFAEAAHRLSAKGITHLAAGDLFLEDVRHYREKLIRRTGLTPLFPLWEQDSRTLLETFFARAYRALTVCIQTEKLPAEFLGRRLDASFLRDLPPEVDPCGERGAFHTFAWDGPLFREPVPFRLGPQTYRRLGGQRFGFQALIPGT